MWSRPNVSSVISRVLGAVSIGTIDIDGYRCGYTKGTPDRGTLVPVGIGADNITECESRYNVFFSTPTYRFYLTIDNTGLSKTGPFTTMRVTGSFRGGTNPRTITYTSASSTYASGIWYWGSSANDEMVSGNNYTVTLT